MCLCSQERRGAPRTPLLPTHLSPQFITRRLLWREIAYNILHETIVAIGFPDETEYGHKNGSDVAAWLPCAIRRGHVERRQTNASSRVDVRMIYLCFEHHIRRFERVAFGNRHIYVEDTTFPWCSRRCRYLCFDLKDILDIVFVRRRCIRTEHVHATRRVVMELP